MNLHRLLADLIVLLHGAYVLFVVGGMALILIGASRGWAWVRGFGFRTAHFLAIALVVVESLGGIACPLTAWENRLRVMAGDEGVAGTFVGRLVHGLIYYDLPEWAFTVVYCLFGGLVFLMLLVARPRWPWRNPAGKAE